MRLRFSMLSLIKRSFLLVLLFTSGNSMGQGGASEVLPTSRAATLESCVATTEDMRRNHMEKLFHKRDQTMREGIRTPDFSLNECVSCHAAKDEHQKFIPVNEEGQFCQTCHERVSAKLDCFQCHRTTPES